MRSVFKVTLLVATPVTPEMKLNGCTAKIASKKHCELRLN